MKPVHIILIYILSLHLTTHAQLSVAGGTLRDDYRFKGTVKSVTEAHWDAGGLFVGRQNVMFSRTGKVTEETFYFGEGDDDIESTRLCNYNADGTMAGLYSYRRGGEKYAVLEHFSHWIAEYDKKGYLIRKRVFEFAPKADKYGTAIWRRTAEEMFLQTEKLKTKNENDTIYTCDKKTGRITSMRWRIDELDFQGEGTATYSYTASGDTLAIRFDDPTGRMPISVEYDYKYVSKLEKERQQNAEANTNQGQKGKAVSPVLEKRKREAEKKNKKKGADADTLRLDVKTVTTRYSKDNRTIIRTEQYDDSCKLVKLNITETLDGEKKDVQEWRWTRKELTIAQTGRQSSRSQSMSDEANKPIIVYQLIDAETTRFIGTEMTYQVKDHFSYDRNGDPVSRTRSGKTLAKPATWRFAYRDYDDHKNWTRRTYTGPANEDQTSTISANGNIIETITYSGEAEETDTRIIKYY